MRPIECRSSSGTRTFYVEGPTPIDVHTVVRLAEWRKLPLGTWRYKVYDSNAPQDGDEFYEAVFVELENGRAMSFTLAHQYNVRYLRKGITPQIIDLAAKDLQRRIVSSTSTDAHKLFVNEDRSPDATRVWCKLVETGFAQYDKASDRFEYLPADS